MIRSYGQYCGLARALDLVGDRWNLLIVRQLLLGPARYSQLRDGLPGIATNLLSDRLRFLEEAGIVERRLSDDHNHVDYALTAWGSQLREPIEALIRWSTPLMVRGPQGDPFRDEWLLIALRALLAEAAPHRSANVGIHLDDHVIGLRATPTGVEVEPAADGQSFDAVVQAEPSVIVGLAAGALAFDEVADAITVDGDQRAVRAVFDCRR